MLGIARHVEKRKRLILFVMALVLAATLIISTPAHAKINVTPNKNALTRDVQNIADNIVTFVRTIFGVIVAVLFIWGAFLLLGGSSNPQRMASAKSKFGYALVALIIVFMADKIVSLIMGLFNFST